MKTFAELCRAARDRHAWTQLQMADAIGIALRTYSDWETGKHQPRVVELAMMVTKLDLDADRFLRSILYDKQQVAYAKCNKPPPDVV